MNQNDKPIGDIVLIGRAGYQIYSHTYRGEVEYRADVGKPWKDRTSGITKVLPFMQDHSTADFQRAAEQAANKLEELRQAAFTQDSLKLAATVTPITFADETEQKDQTPIELKLANG